MAFKSTKSRVIIPIVEMTPMIDIVFLLIIFFMVAAQFAQQAHVELNLPSEIGEQNEAKPKNALVINILNDGSILIDKSKGALTLQEVENIVTIAVEEEQLNWQNIRVRADENVKAGSLNEVLVILNKLGLSATNIATESP